MNRIRKITIINPITDEKSVYQIRLLYDGEDMENNNLCFCGSGIKKKKCHPLCYWFDNANEIMLIKMFRLKSSYKYDENNFLG